MPFNEELDSELHSGIEGHHKGANGQTKRKSHQGARSGSDSKGPITGQEHVPDEDQAVEARGEHPEEPAEGRADKRDRMPVQDPHGEHPEEPAEGRADKP